MPKTKKKKKKMKKELSFTLKPKSNELLAKMIAASHILEGCGQN